MKKIILALASLGLLANCATTQTTQTTKTANVEAPSEASQEFPTDLRRTTLIVDDIDESLKLYRDVLGFEVNYDTVVTMSGVALPAGNPGSEARLVLMNSNDSWVGWIGMLQWLEPNALPRKPKTGKMGIGDMVMVFNTTEVDKQCDAAAKLPEITITTPKSESRYPSRNGGPPIVVHTCYMFDRDGYFLEINQLQDRESYNAD
ncbi:VOC family protein [Hirschia litorea]|uniref:VOC family protein n=1 Tax=Hirschia litorea TaxID=1199156 RepID=A0ABW2INA7_9PROT